MVAIFTGLGAGFAHGSRTSLGASGLLGGASLGRAGEGVFLNAQTGNLVLTQQDEFLTGVGPDVAIGRTYNTVAALNENGDRWRQTTDKRLVLTGVANAGGSAVTRTLADGSSVIWTWNGSAYVTSDLVGEAQTVTYDAVNQWWTWRDSRNHLTETYKVSDQGYISSIAHDDGNSLVYSYVAGGPAGQLEKVTSDNGEWVQYVYGNGNATDITSIVTHYGAGGASTLTRTRYSYDASHRLTEVTIDLSPEDNSISDGRVFTTTYGYDASGRLSTIRQRDTATGNASLAITYDGSNRVIALVQAVQGSSTRRTDIVYGAGYADITSYTEDYASASTPHVTTRVSFAVSASGFMGLMTDVTRPMSDNWDYTYDSQGRVTHATDPLNRTTVYTYGTNGNVATITDPNNNVVTRTYDAQNNLILEERIGANGASAAASLYTRYVYDAQNRLRYTISAAKRVTAYDYDAITGLLSRTTTFPTAAYTEVAAPTLPTLAQMNSWRSTTLTSIDKANVEIEDYHYDGRGNIDWTKSYSAADENGPVTSGGYTLSTFNYDTGGRLLSRSVGPQNAETFIYDGLGRVIVSTNLLGEKTAIVFDDVNDTTKVVTLAGAWNGSTQTYDPTADSYISVSTYDKTGNLISRTDTVPGQNANTTTGTQSLIYDRLGRLRQSTDASGRTQYFLYDDNSRKIADIGQNGEVVEYRYDAADRIIATVRYAQKLNSSDLGAIAGNAIDDWVLGANIARPSTSDAGNIAQWTIYDAGGRVIETIAGDGSSTKYEYDNSNRLVRTTSFYNKLSVSGFFATPPTSATWPTGDAKDRITRSFYDGDGLLVGALNADGFFSRIVYDNAGRKVQEIAYANAPTGTPGTDPFQTVLANTTSNAARDRSARYVYDGQGLLRYQIDGLGFVTEYVYRTTDASNPDHGHAIGPVRQTIRYKTALSGASSYTYADVNGHVASDSADRISYAVYNSAGQLSYAIDAAGSVTGFVYDGAGRITKTTAFATAYAGALNEAGSSTWFATMSTWAANAPVDTHPDNRITRTYYNVRGDVLYSIDAEGYATGFAYDAAGRVTAQHRYPNQLTLAERSTLAGVQGASKGAPATVTTTYDSFGRVASVTDGAGAITQFVYYANGALQFEIRASGQAGESKSAFFYDQAGRKTRASHGYGASEQTDSYFTYDGLGNLATVTDPRGAVTTYTYDKIGRVAKVATSPNAGVTIYEVEYAYDAFGNALRIKDARGNYSYSYFDKLGRVELVVDNSGFATQTTYTAFGEIGTVTRRYTATSGAALGAPPSVPTNTLDATTSFTYDKLGRVTRIDDAAGAYEAFTHNAFGERTSVRNKLGGVTTYVYDDRGLAIAETRPVSSVLANGAQQAATVTNTFAYDARGNRITIVEAAGLSEQRTTTYEYDAASRLTRISHQATYVAADATAEPSGSPVTPIEQFFYDLRGNLIEKRDPSGARTLYWYDKLGRITHEISATGALQRFFYDANGNRTEARAYAITVTLPADATGSPPAGSGDYRRTLYVYDALNRVKEVKTPDIKTGAFSGSVYGIGTQDLVTTYEYDANGNVVRRTDANGAQTWSYYDVLGRKTVEIDPLNYRTAWSYDSDGNVLSERRYASAGATPANTTSPPAAPAETVDDRLTTFTYDKMGRRLTETRAAVKVHNGSGAHTSTGATIIYTYNGLGLVTSKTEATGDAITYAYDLGGRMTEEQRSAFTDVNGASVTPTIQYSYNGLDALSRVKALGAGGTFAAGERITRYAYDAAGRLSSVTDAEDFVRAYVYDVAGRVVREEYNRINLAAAADEGVGYSYDAEGRIVAQGFLRKIASAWTRSNFASGLGQTIDTTNIEYNAFGEVSRRGLNGVYAEQYHYDGAGRLIRTNGGDGMWKYFLYDKNGNQTLMIASSGSDLAGAALDTLDEVLALWASPSAIATTNVAGVVATLTKYDARNQATLVIEPQRQLNGTTSADLRTSRAYNAFGEVARETNANGHDGVGDPITTASLEYLYNTMGRLIQTTSPAVSITGENGAVTNNYRPVEHRYYDAAGRLVASRDGNGNLTRMTLLAGTGYGGSQALTSEVIGADGFVQRTRYDIHGDARRIENQLYNAGSPHLHRKLQTFDDMGRLVSVEHAGGSSPSARLVDYYAYDGLGQRTKHWNSQLGLGNAELITYDQQGRVLAVTAMGGDITQYAYGWDPNIVTTGMGAFGGWKQVTTYANSKTLTEFSDQFKRMTQKIDLGAHTTNFTYDKAGRLTNRSATHVVSGQTAALGYALTFAHYNTGRLATITQNGGAVAYISPGQTYRGVYSEFGGWFTELDRVQTFGYDKLGNVVAQALIENSVYDGDEYYVDPDPWYFGDEYGDDPPPQYYQETVSNQSATYDALGRLATWSETGSVGSHMKGRIGAATHTFAYDANGNVRRSLANYRAIDTWGNIASSPTTQDYWYRYDSMNRMVVAKGQLSGGVISRGSYGADIFYNAVGERAYTIDAVPGGPTRREDYYYNEAGRLSEVRSGENLSLAGVKRGDYSYDLMGRMTLQRDYDTDGASLRYSRTVTYNNKSQTISDVTWTRRGFDNLSESTATYDYGAGANYALGAPVSISSTNRDSNNGGASWTTKYTLTTNQFEWWDGAMQAQTTYDRDIYAADALWNTWYYYDAIGGAAQLRQASILDGRPRVVTFMTDMLAQVVWRGEKDNVGSAGDPTEVWHRFSGRQMGYVGNNGTLDTDYNTSVGYRTMNPGSYAFFNGQHSAPLHADFDLAYDSINSYTQGSNRGMYVVQAGDTLSGIAAALWGDASLWWKLAEVNGLTAESQLVEGMPLIIPAGVVVHHNTALTYQPYDPMEVLGNTSPTSPKPVGKKGNDCGVVGAVILVVIAAVVTYFTWGATSEWFAASLGNLAGAVAAGATAGAAGSVVSQGVGVATGIQDKFSWNAVALGAIGGAVGASGVGGMAAKAVGATGRLAYAAVSGMVNNVIAQGIGVAVGAQEKFSWAGVAAAGVGSAAFSLASQNLAGRAHGAIVNGVKTNVAATTFNRLGATAASTLASAATRSLIEGSSFGDNIMAALPDVIGQTIGNAIAGRMAGAGSGTTGSAKVGSTPKNANEVKAACQVTDLQDPRVVWVEDPKDMNYVSPEDRARAQIVWSGEMPVVEEEEIIVTGTRQRRTNPLAGYVPYELRPESERTYANAAPPGSYWGDVGNRMRMGWNNAWANFRHELGGPTSVEDVFRRSADPFGTRYITSTLNLAFEPLAEGVGEMSRPLFPDSDGEWQYRQQNRAHPNWWDPQHVRTGQDQRNFFGYGAVSLATMRAPVGRVRGPVRPGSYVDFSAIDGLAPGYYRANPGQLRFTQSTASPNFGSGGTIDDLIADLNNGLTPDQVRGGPLQVVMHDGVPFSIDNRRLVAFNAAGVSDIPIQVVSLSDQAVAARFFGRFDPIGGEGRFIAVTRNNPNPYFLDPGRSASQQLLYDQGLIRRAP